MRDEHGYPGTLGEDGTFDGGDTAAIIGTFAALTCQKPFCQFPWDRKWNKPLRHPDKSKWYGQNDRFSRDQLIPLLCMLVEFPHSVLAEMAFKAHSMRGFLLAWNSRKNGSMDAPKKFPDLTGPEIWALWIRVWRPRWRYLVLWFLDLELLGGSIHWKFRKDRVCRNHMLSLIICRRRMPTWVSKLAYWLTDFDDLIGRWKAHCEAVGEEPTWHLFYAAVHGKAPPSLE